MYEQYNHMFNPVKWNNWPIAQHIILQNFWYNILSIQGSYKLIYVYNYTVTTKPLLSFGFSRVALK